MNSNSGKTNSVWLQSGQIPSFQQLATDDTADVCIVGAGIAGLTCGYLLVQEGKRIVVLDDGPVGGGETGRTTAHLSNALDDRYFELEKIHGTDGSRLAAESHSAAIDRIEKIVRDEIIDCDFSRLDGYLFVPPGESTDILIQELDAALRAGLTAVELVEGMFGASLRFPGQGQLHPLKYLSGLVRCITSKNGRIFTGTHVNSIKGGSPAVVTTSNGCKITAQSIIVATNTPVNDLVVIHTKQFPYRSYVIGARIPKGSVPKALFWDTLDPYHYVRVQKFDTHDVLIVGGEDHKTGHSDDAEQRFANLELWAMSRFPAIESVEFRWSGQVIETMDGLAFIGRNPMDSENVYIATGDSGMGMTHGTIAGMLLTDLIMGRTNPWTALYDPSRKPVRAGSEWLKENLDVAAKYAEWATGGEVGSVDEIPIGEGAIIRRGVSKIATYRDTDGSITQCSAKCTHLACVVHWNSGEKTWDCPCHGSRWDKLGHILNGPALTDLKEIDVKAA